MGFTNSNPSHISRPHEPQRGGNVVLWLRTGFKDRRPVCTNCSCITDGLGTCGYINLLVSVSSSAKNKQSLSHFPGLWWRFKKQQHRTRYVKQSACHIISTWILNYRHHHHLHHHYLTCVSSETNETIPAQLIKSLLSHGVFQLGDEEMVFRNAIPSRESKRCL